MKKVFIFILSIIGSVLFASCSSKEAIQQRLDDLFSQKEELIQILSKSDLSIPEIVKETQKLEEVENDIKTLLKSFSIRISDRNLGLAKIPFASEDEDITGEWFFNNIIYPIYFFESDYAPIVVHNDENFSPQEKFNILSYHLREKNKDLLTEKYSHLIISEADIKILSLELFNEEIIKTDVSQYDSETRFYSVPNNYQERILTPIYGGSQYLSANRLEVSVYYAEKTMTQAIYTEYFVFERRDDNTFYLHSRTRNNESISLAPDEKIRVDASEICFLELQPITSKKSQETNLDIITVFLMENYDNILDNYFGSIHSVDSLSVSSVINMILFMQPNIDSLISENDEKYTYFGIDPDFLNQQISYFFGDKYFEKESSEYYDSEHDVYLFRISDAVKTTYHKEIHASYVLENGNYRIETELYSPDIITQFVAKAVTIFSPNKDGTFTLVSRRFNRHTATAENSVFADIVPVYPEPYPNVSTSEAIKGEWLYNTYAPFLTINFESVDKIPSETLANFAIERLFESDAFEKYKTQDGSFAFPEYLIVEQIKLFFGETDFSPAYVSYYDMQNKVFCVNLWSIRKRDISGKVVKTTDLGSGLFSIYVEYPSESSSVYSSETYVFSQQSDKTFHYSSITVQSDEG